MGVMREKWKRREGDKGDLVHHSLSYVAVFDTGTHCECLQIKQLTKKFYSKKISSVPCMYHGHG